MGKTGMRQFFIGALAVTCVLSYAGFAAAQAPTALKLDDILQAGQRRQERVKSFHFAWTQHVTDGKGGKTLPPRMNPSGEETPPRDVSYEMHPELWVDGEKMRFAFEDYQWSRKEQACVPRPHLATFDGRLSKTLMENASPEMPHPMGFINKRDRHPDTNSIYLVPLLMAFRAADPRMRVYDLSQMTLTARQVKIDGHVCHEVQFQQPGTHLIDHLWVDPARDYVILRYVKLDKERLAYQVNVRYSEDPTAGWVPSGWDLVSQLQDGRLQTASQSQVVQYEINPSIPSDQFDVVFPRGTSVADLAAERSYIIKQDGTERPVLKEELGLSYEQALSSEPGELVGKGPPLLSRWWARLLAGAVSLAALTILAVRYRAKRRRLPGTAPPRIV